MRTREKLLGLIIICLMSVLIIFTPSLVRADGCAIGIHGVIAERGQKAVIVWDENDERETLILNASYGLESLSEFSWIIPIQSSSDPNVIEYENDNYDGDAFAVMEDLFPQLNRTYSWESYYGSGFSMPSSSSSSVKVLDIKQIDVYELCTVHANDKDILINWLEDCNYPIPNGFPSLVDDYIDNNGCYFVINRINLEGKYQNELDNLASYHLAVYNSLMGDDLNVNKLNGLVDDLTARVADDIYQGKDWSDVSSFVQYIMSEYRYTNLKNGSFDWGDLKDEVEEEIKESEFFDSIYELVDGRGGTPIMITFYPDEPIYPLRISSISGNNYGGIDVYFIGPTVVEDKNDILDMNHEEGGIAPSA